MQVAAYALLAIIMMTGFSLWSSKYTITGAVVGQSAPYTLCLTKYGRDNDGNFDWEKIRQCRNMYKEIEENDAAVPRLYLSSDRSRYQNEK